MAKEPGQGQCVFHSPTLAAEIFFFMFNAADALLLPLIRLLIQNTTCLEVSLSEDISCNSTTSASMTISSHQATSIAAAKLASTYFIAASVLRNVPSLLLALCCGAWSDSVGRTLPSIAGITGIMLAVAVYISSRVLIDTPSTALVLILLGSAVQGSFGDSTVVTMATYSYVSDRTTAQTRTRILGRLIGLNMFGNVVGSFMFGALMHATSFTVALSVALALLLLSAGLCFLSMTDHDHRHPFFMPCCRERDAGGMVTQGNNDKTIQEGITSSNVIQGNNGVATREGVSWLSQESNGAVTHEDRPSPSKSRTQLFQCKNILDSIAVFTQARPGGHRLHILIFSITVFAHRMCRAGELDCILLVAVLQPLAWVNGMYGYFLAADYAMLGVCVVLVLPVILQCGRHPSDINLILIGILFRVVRMLLIMFSTATWHMLLAVILGSPAVLIVASCKSLLSKTVGTEDTGKMFALISSGETVFTFVGTIVFVSIYHATVAIYPPFVFAAIASVYFMLLALVCYAKYHQPGVDQQPMLSSDSSSAPLHLQQEYGTLKAGSK